MDATPPPNNQNMEQAVLGSLFCGDKEQIDEVFKTVDPAWFYHDKNKVIFQVMRKKYESGVYPDLTLACQWLTDAGVLAEVGGQKYLVESMEHVSTTWHTMQYVSEIRKLYYDRQIKAAIFDVSKDPTPENIEKLRAKREEKDGANAQGILSLKDCIPKVCEMMEPLAKGMYEIFGFEQNDEYHNGMTAGDILTIGARPRVGKTVIATHIVINFAKKYPMEPVLYFSTEMSYEETLQRILAPLSGVPGWKFRKRYFDKDGNDVKKIGAAAEELAKLNIYVVDKPSPTLAEIRAAMAATKARLVVLDYLQVINLETEKDEGKPAAYGRFLYGFKHALRGLGAMAVVLSQLDREIDHLSGKERPQMGDLKGSGDIEQISNSVLLMWPYNKKDRETKMELVPKLRNVKPVEIIHAKHRTGKSDVSVQMIFDEEYICFHEWNTDVAMKYNDRIESGAPKEKKDAKKPKHTWGKPDASAGGYTDEPESDSFL